MSKRETAMELFSEGYNCAQSVLLAFCSELGLDRATAAKLALSFGGGMGQMRETCGALTGAFMVLGLLDPSNTPPTPAEKTACYQKVRKLADDFRTANGSTLCRELLALAKENAKSKNCRELVGATAEQIEKFLQRQSEEDCQH
ncbi:MAG: C-GCAxxG-C-C family protein [Clostridia bacterium]